MRLLIIDDDAALCEALSIQLQSCGYDVDYCLSGEDALFYAMHNTYGVILLDRMLPVTDRVEGLDAGADDYIVKPFDTQELMARIRALIRRPSAIDAGNTLSYADLTLDASRQELYANGHTLSLSRRETSLFEYFLRNKNQALSRDMLLSYVWGPACEVEDGNLDNYIHFARKRLKTLKSTVQIKTIHGTGYRMEDTDVSKAP